MHILGVFGPWQLMVLTVLFVLPAILITILLVNRAKHKSSAETLDKVLIRQETQSDDVIEKLEKLNRLRESGALSDEEFETQKKKVLG